MRPNTHFKILASLMVFRAIWAFFLFGLMGLFLLGLASSAGISADWPQLAARITMTQYLVWGVYAFGYGLAAYLFLKRVEASTWVFGGAMVLDFGLWLYMAAHADNGFEWSGIGRGIDTFLNVVDMFIWFFLVALAINDFFKRPDTGASDTPPQKRESEDPDGTFLPVR
jgi:hypothetical protein